MGLDVTAYEIVELVKADPTEEEREAMGEDDDIHALYPVAPFEKHSDGLPDGLYRISGKALSAFHRSYSGYNRWREGLAARSGAPARRPSMVRGVQGVGGDVRARCGARCG